MKRRHFMALVGSAVASSIAARPPTALAQQPTRLPRIGVLLFSTPQGDPNLQPFLSALRELGHVEGRSVAIEYRYAEGRSERLIDLAAELANLRPDLLYALGGDVALPVMKATQTIPIVFATSTDPVQHGLVAALARPGANVTGVTFVSDDLASKRMELLKEAAPHVSRVACLWNPDHIENEMREAQRAAAKLHVELQALEVRRPGDIDGALREVVTARMDALYVVSSRLTLSGLNKLVPFAMEHRLPLAGGWGAWAKSGGLLSYGPNLGVMMQHSASYVDRILKGARPSDLPIEQPTTFELVINLKTAKALGLTVPPTLLARADELIE
jgi:putative tryptophan/tyrosine transport system substrate-binding protein